MNKVGKSDAKMNRRETARRTRTEQKTLWLVQERASSGACRDKEQGCPGGWDDGEIQGRREEQKETETGGKNCKNQKLQIKTTKAQTNSGEQRFVTKWGAYPA